MGINAPKSVAAGTVIPGARFLRRVHAANRSILAFADSALLMFIVPFTCTGSKPQEVPGSSETSPFIIVPAPVLVIAEVAMIP